jgi:hypothetical protein
VRGAGDRGRLPAYMTRELLEQLLREGESARLDYKQESYPFADAEPEDKEELLKDVLAFANAWQSQDAYILTGVKHESGKPAEACGIVTPVDDSRLQQFVNGKTNRRLEFSYSEFDHDGLLIGVFRIPVQLRPFFLKKPFARLSAKTVWYRIGSATAVADPDEIARMGAAPSPERPALTLQFIDPETREDFGPAVAVSTVQLAPTREALPSPGSSVTPPGFSSINANFYPQIQKYLIARGRVADSLVQASEQLFCPGAGCERATENCKTPRLLFRGGHPQHSDLHAHVRRFATNGDAVEFLARRFDRNDGRGVVGIA